MRKNTLLKKILSTSLALGIILTSFTFVNATAFSDIEGHWAESYINTLISDGTINGYEDGTFRPSSAVTRAEFTKMIGKGPTRFESDFADVPTTHWGYEYIMYSGLEGEGKNFNPSTPILRRDVVNLIWKRNGSVTGCFAPSIITKQSNNKEAVAWAYSNGLLVGDDGINLRLDDTLTRAEAATFIVRSRQIDPNKAKTGFIDALSDKTAQVIYDSLNLFDDEYSKDDTITNGEMARAVLIYGTRKHDLTNSYRYSKELFTNEYAKDLYLIGKECIGIENVTEEFANKNATVSNTLAELVYNAKKLVTKSLKLPDSIDYSDTKTVSPQVLRQLSFARGYDVLLYANDTITPDKEITKKEFIALLIQLDEIIGCQLAYDMQTPSTISLNKNVLYYPENYKDYSCILKGIPNVVYTTPIGKKMPKDCTETASNLALTYRTALDEIVKKAALNDITLKTTFYPTLTSANGDNTIARVKFEFSSVLSEASLSKIINVNDASLDFIPKSGEVYYMDIEFPPILDLYVSSDNVKIINVIK